MIKKTVETACRNIELDGKNGTKAKRNNTNLD